MEIVDHELENGARLLVIPMPSTETVTTLAMFGTGSRTETIPERGLAHFTEHMFFKGTKKRPTTLEVAATIENVGGEFNAFTDKEQTAYYAKLPARHLSIGLDFLSDMMLNPLVPAEEAEREKGVVLEEINMYEDSPMQDVASIIDEAVWGDTPMGRPVIGVRETVSSFKRDNVVNFIASNYVGSNMVIAVAGNVKPEEVKDQVEKYFGAVKSGSRVEPEPADNSRGNHRQIKSKKTEQTHFILAVPTFAVTDERKYTARVLAALLGGGMTSRLFISVRERQGLCYYIHAGHHQFTDTGLFQIAAGVDTSRLDQALNSTLGEIVKIKSELAEAEELQRAKELIKGRMLIRLEDSEEVANFFAKQASNGVPLESPLEVMRQIDAVSAKQVQQLAAELFTTDHLALATVGPKSAADIQALSV